MSENILPQPDIAFVEQGRMSLQQRAGRTISRLALGAVCVFPVADVALSDGLAIKAYQYAQENVEIKSPIEKAVVVNGMLSLGIAAQCVAVSTLLVKNKRLSTAFEDFHGYTAERQESMSPARKVVSKVANSPFNALGKVGASIENFGKRIERSDSKLVKKTGRTITDIGMVNAMGPPLTVLSEIADDKKPSFRRVVRLSTLFGATWTGVAQGVTQLYRNVPVVRPPLAAIGETFQALTTVSLANPAETPVGTGFIGTVAVLLAANGWNIAKYHEQKESQQSPATDQNQQH